MSLTYMGEQFDVHTGGVDNIFPHHEDEIAQSEPVTGRIPARIWVHGEHLLASGRKMAKSVGNFMRATALEVAGIEPLALRYLALTARYGHKLHASEDSLAGAQAALSSLRARLHALGPPPTEGSWRAPPKLIARPAGDRPQGQAAHAAGHGSEDERPFALIDRAHAPPTGLSSPARELHDRFVAALDDDLDLPGALAVVRDTLRAEIASAEKRWLVLDADLVLGLDLHASWSAPSTRASSPALERLVGDRARARAAGDYATADALREELRRLGVEVVDQPARE